ncbi:unnamed protein product [Pleuronectes platessa]|uniref:Uncharacterized protein n=1 Tax=Pleuronectes platessa TaxID=8262 RepID=A0A9N7TT47_PLEPL|nr:unnamed protein product [Pleuronectes platessa]
MDTYSRAPASHRESGRLSDKPITIGHIEEQQEGKITMVSRQLEDSVLEDRQQDASQSIQLAQLCFQLSSHILQTSKYFNLALPSTSSDRHVYLAVCQKGGFLTTAGLDVRRHSGLDGGENSRRLCTQAFSL